jgi:NUMOD3 motif-containing protein
LFGHQKKFPVMETMMRKGARHTEASKRAISEAMRGKPGPRGVKRSAQTRARMSAAKAGKPLSDDHKRAIGEGQKASQWWLNRPPIDNVLTCIECGREFRPHRLPMKYCSRECQKRFSDRPLWRRNEIIKQLERQ